jgi:hypothetical protein
MVRAVSVLDKPKTHLAIAEALVAEIKGAPNVFWPGCYATELLAVARLFEAPIAMPE